MGHKDELIAVRELLASDTRWTHDAFARTATRKSVPPDHPDAVCWCLRGAYIRVTGRDLNRSEDPLWSEVIDACQREFGATPITLNEMHGHTAILSVLDTLIHGRD